jgi:clan AA aspartic protease (TIGR02281 family)
MIAMLALALRYLMFAVVVGAGFAMIQGGDWRDRATTTRAGKPSMASNASHDTATRPTSESEGWEYVVEAGSHGHFVIDAVVDGVPLTFLLDTGASDIVLTLDDARQLGFLPQTLEFSRRFRTANGEVRGAPVRLRELRIGQFSLYDLDASVNEAPLAISLLGMRFLDRLNGYQVEDGRLILRW